MSPPQKLTARSLLAAISLLAAAPLSTAQVRPSPQELEERLPETRGVERVRTLAALVDVYKSSAPAKALGYGESALHLAESFPDPVAEVQALDEMAWALMELGRYDEAVARAEQGLARARGGLYRRGEARALSNLGTIARLRGEFAEALERFRESLAIYEAIGDEAAVATSLSNISVVQGFDTGDYQPAIENQLAALEIQDRLGDESGRYQSYANLGVIYDNMGDQAQAARYLDMALEGWRSVGNRPRVAATLGNLAGLRAKAGDLDTALELQREALAIRRELSNRSGEAYSLEMIGSILTKLGRVNEARESLEESLRIRRELGEPKTEAESLLALARLDFIKGGLPDAEVRLDSALSIARRIVAPEVERDVLLERANVREARGNPEGALASYKEGDAIARRLLDDARTRRVAARESDYRTSREQQEIARLRSDNALTASLAQQRRTQMLVAILVALVGFLLYRRHVTAKHERNLEEQVVQRTAELSEANARLRELSLTDTLTGLPNRRSCFQAVESDVAVSLRAYGTAAREAEPAEKADLVFYALDLDDFKSVNDQYGHAAGDAVLQQVADVLRDTSRASDMVVRWGGEEFLVVSRHVDRRGASAFAERIRQAVRSHIFAAGDGRVLHRTCSVGFAAFPFLTTEPEGVPWDTVIELADQACYAAKRSGRDAWVEILPTARTVAAGVHGTRSSVTAGIADGTLATVSSLDGSEREVVWGDVGEQPLARPGD